MLTGDFSADIERARPRSKRKPPSAPPCHRCGGVVEHPTRDWVTARETVTCFSVTCDACDKILGAIPRPRVGQLIFRPDPETGGRYLRGFIPLPPNDFNERTAAPALPLTAPPAMKPPLPIIDAHFELLADPAPAHGATSGAPMSAALEAAVVEIETFCAAKVAEIAPLIPAKPASEREHAKISPSGMRNLEICPRYAPDREAPAHPVTESGTRIHDAVEADNNAGLDEEEIRLADMCRDYMAGLAESEAAYELEGETEVKLDVTQGVWGFADLVILVRAEKRGHLVDWKTGFLSQEDVETNPAAQAYALGVFKKHPWMERLDVHYIYPRREEMSLATFTRDQMGMFELRCATIIARVESNQPPFAEVDNCTFCGRKADCPALHALALPIARRYAEAKTELVIPDEYQPSQISDPDVMAKAMAVAQVLGDWVDSVKHHALAMRQEQGLELPGYELRKRSAGKRILDFDTAQRLAREAGVTNEDFLGCVAVSLKKLSDAVGEKAPAKGKKVAVTKLEDALRDAGALDPGHDTFFLQREAKNKKHKQLETKK